jgi:hypothetical protein
MLLPNWSNREEESLVARQAKICQNLPKLAFGRFWLEQIGKQESKCSSFVAHQAKICQNPANYKALADLVRAF